MKNVRKYKICDLKYASCKSRNDGFTLLELIIALTILTLVTLLISNGFRIGMNAWEKGEAETGETQRLRVLSGLLYQQLKSAYPYNMEIEDEKVVLFEGEADNVLFVTSLTDSSYGGLKWVRYSYKDETILYKEGILPDKKLTDQLSGNEEILDSEIDEFNIEYFSTDDGEWKKSWDFGGSLPGAVRIKISYFQPFVIHIPMSKDKTEGEDA